MYTIINNACTNSADSAAIGKSYYNIYIYPGAKHRYKYGKYTREVLTRLVWSAHGLCHLCIPSSTRIVQGRQQGIYGLGKGLQILLQTFNNSQRSLHYTGCHLQQSIEQSGTCLGLGNEPYVRLCTSFALPLKIILYRDMFLSNKREP